LGDPVCACHDHAGAVCALEIVVQNCCPDGLHKLAPAVRDDSVGWGFEVHLLVPVFKVVGKLESLVRRLGEIDNARLTEGA
jgi:hypothetical protein